MAKYKSINNDMIVEAWQITKDNIQNLAHDLNLKYYNKGDKEYIDALLEENGYTLYHPKASIGDYLVKFNTGYDVLLSDDFKRVFKELSNIKGVEKSSEEKEPSPIFVDKFLDKIEEDKESDKRFKRESVKLLRFNAKELSEEISKAKQDYLDSERYYKRVKREETFRLLLIERNLDSEIYIKTIEKFEELIKDKYNQKIKKEIK